MSPKSPPRPRSTPKPDARIEPTPEEFEAWCEHPTTRWVAAAWLAGAALQEREWNALLTNGREVDLTIARAELNTRADAYRAFCSTGHADYSALNTPNP